MNEDVNVQVDRVLSWRGDDPELAVWLAANGINPDALKVPSEVAVRGRQVWVEPGAHWPVRRDEGWTPLVVSLPDALEDRADLVVLASADDAQGRHWGAARRLTADTVRLSDGLVLDHARHTVARKVREQLTAA